MQRLTREQILNAQLRTKEVDVPEWGGSIIIRELSVATQADIEDNSKNNIDRGVKMILEGVIDPKFEPSDYEQLKGLGSGPMTHVLSEIAKFSGMDENEASAIPNGSKKTA